jgi:hypothetical protein
MKVARYEVPGMYKIWPRPGGTVEIGLRAKLCVPNFTPAPNQASLRDAPFFVCYPGNKLPAIVKSFRTRRLLSFLDPQLS